MKHFVVYVLFCIAYTQCESNDTLIDLLCDGACTFEVGMINSRTIKWFPKKCSTVCSDLKINNQTDLTETQLTSVFKNMKTLVGSLAIINTKFKSASFLSRLEVLECDDSYFMVILNAKMTEIGMESLRSISCRIYVANNNKMIRLNVPNLKTILPTNSNDSDVFFGMSSLSPEFCISIQEMSNFLDNPAATLNYIPGKYCEVSTDNGTEKVCGFENSTLSQMESGCVHVRGDVIVESGDEVHVDKLETVKGIFGKLTIDGTNLTDIDFLDNLEYVAALQSDEAAIEINYNTNLSNVSFPSLKRVLADTRYSIIFQNNSQNLVMDPNICFGIRNSLNLTDDSAPTIDGKNCERIQADAIVRSKSSFSHRFSLFFVVFFLFLGMKQV